mgnify:CR=1 FL=1
MTTLSHVAVGYLISRYLVVRGILPHEHTTYIMGIVFANLPDIDGALSLKQVYNHQNHLQSISHYPANWLLVLVFFFLLSLPFTDTTLFEFTFLASACILSHFVLDTFSIYGGIAWLGPWIKKRYSFIRILPITPNNNHEWVHWYLKHWIKYLEIALWAVSILTMLKAKHGIVP